MPRGVQRPRQALSRFCRGLDQGTGGGHRRRHECVSPNRSKCWGCVRLLQGPLCVPGPFHGVRGTSLNSVGPEGPSRSAGKEHLGKGGAVRSAAGAGTEAALQGPGRRQAGAHPAGPRTRRARPGCRPPPAPRPPTPPAAWPRLTLAPEARSLPPPALSGPRVPELGLAGSRASAPRPLPGPHHPQAVSSPSRRCRRVGPSAARRCQCLQSRGPGSRQAPSGSSPAGPQAVLGHLAAVSSLSLHTGRTQDQELLVPPRRFRVDPRSLGLWARGLPHPTTSSKAWGARPPPDPSCPAAWARDDWRGTALPLCSHLPARVPHEPRREEQQARRPPERPSS